MLGIRAVYCFSHYTRNPLQTVGEVRALTDAELLSRRNLGRKSLAWLRATIGPAPTMRVREGDMNEETGIPGWCVVDIMGHIRYAGRISEASIAGTLFLRIDIPGDDVMPAETIYQAPASLYALRPCTEALARTMAPPWRPQPIQEWDLPTELREKLRALDDAPAPRRSRRHWQDDDDNAGDGLDDDRDEDDAMPFE